MRIDEAIKILENDPPRPHPLNRDEFEQAFSLGIEALKRIKEGRNTPYGASLLLLLGETKD